MFNSIKVIQQNIRKSPTAHNEFRNSIMNCSSDILALQEPYVFKNRIPFSLSSRIYHSHPQNGTIYSAIVIVNNSLTIEHLTNFTNSFATTIKIQTKSTSLILVNLYLHSNIFCDLHHDFFVSILSTFFNLPIIFCGDFNARNPYWHDTITNRNGNKLKDIIDSQSLIVLNSKTKTCRNASIIDLTVTNSKAYSYVSNWNVTRLCEMSDHETIVFTINSFNDQFEKHYIKSTWKFIESDMSSYLNNIDQHSICCLNQFLHDCNSFTNIDSAISKLTKIYIEAAYKVFPVRKSSSYPKKYSWWSNLLDSQKQYFHYIKNLYYRHDQQVSYEFYKNVRNNYIKSIRKAKRDSFRSFLEDVNSSDHFGNTYRILKLLTSNTNNKIPMIDQIPSSEKQHQMNHMLNQIRKLSINNNKTNILYLFKKNKPVIYHSNHQISPSDSIKILGLTFGNHRHLSKLNFSPHINNIVDKSQRICRILFALIGNTWGLPCKKRINLYKGMIRPAISYGYQIWFNQINKSQIKKIDSLQYRILAKSIQAYCSVSENIVHLICSLPKLSDYFHTHLITKHIHDYHLKAIEVKNIENLLLLKYYNGSNDTFKKFFVSPSISTYLRLASHPPHYAHAVVIFNARSTFFYHAIIFLIETFSQMQKIV
ncbi:hypothetical protein DERF_001755 [Dermatophagoides farinae]|uniref:Endonuclease/exonuclease/phosphatase domain-containing protein n=1 Tax=Dermatophagoides farinae TaxID=6954 RepID=A0A922IB28_DERFA|nr:hypothetical protein DERF_001755 [Dermatophagoides farinae]